MLSGSRSRGAASPPGGAPSGMGLLFGSRGEELPRQRSPRAALSVGPALFPASLRCGARRNSSSQPVTISKRPSHEREAH